jgi:hypothetical protein
MANFDYDFGYEYLNIKELLKNSVRKMSFKKLQKGTFLTSSLAPLFRQAAPKFLYIRNCPITLPTWVKFLATVLTLVSKEESIIF